MPAHGPNTHFKAYRFKQHLTFDELIFVIISHGHFASGERRTESFASWWQVNSVRWSVTPYASQIRTPGMCLEDHLAHTVDLVMLNASACLHFNCKLTGCWVTGLKAQRLHRIHVVTEMHPAWVDVEQCQQKRIQAFRTIVKVTYFKTICSSHSHVEQVRWYFTILLSMKRNDHEQNKKSL